ncbi:MAG TPA: hypothetical protein VF599_17370 [Pyrinomonadaceae bacterium]|jgi:hypothetical protein
MGEIREPNYLIAAHAFDSARSRLLLTTPAGSLKGSHLEVDLSEFTGQGFGIYLCRRIELPEEEINDHQERIVALELAGKQNLFKVLEIVELFPLVEGTFTPGIYRISDEPVYHEIKSVARLLEIYRLYASFQPVETVRLVCSDEGIEVKETGKERAEVFSRSSRYPFTFFDVHCPFCRQKVVTYEIAADSEFSICEDIEIPCPHFVGGDVWCAGDYENQTLERLGIRYKFENGDLYLAISRGGWEEAFVLVPASDPQNSRWNSTLEGDSKTDRETSYYDHFFFLEAGTHVLA